MKLPARAAALAGCCGSKRFLEGDGAADFGGLVADGLVVRIEFLQLGPVSYTHLTLPTSDLV